MKIFKKRKKVQIKLSYKQTIDLLTYLFIVDAENIEFYDKKAKKTAKLLEKNLQEFIDT